MDICLQSIEDDRRLAREHAARKAAERDKEPGANVLKAGFRTPIPRVPEDATAIKDRQLAYFDTLCPRNFFHAWLVDDVALINLRLERVARIERRECDRIALRARHCWDADRALEAAQLGARVGSDPERVVALLKRTPHGCEWLMTRWAMLARVADLDGGWDGAQTSLAFDLLGTPEALRRGRPGESIDLDGRAAGDGPDPATVARRQVERLREARVEVLDADALDRAMAENDMTDGTSLELRRLRRYEATLHKRLRWNLHQLQQVPKWATPHPDLRYLYEPDPGPAPEPAQDAPAADPPRDTATSEPEAMAAVEPAPAATSRPRRPDPVALKADARRASRRRTDERRLG